ncbi:sialate O-acetylesterase [Dyadobacter beijingensis]|nr:sialate O-acetylesterase [Dyadobacter beijingensis]
MKRLFMAFMLIGLCMQAHAQMSLSLPLPRSVFQRNANNQASVIISGQLLPGSPSNYQIKYRYIKLKKDGTDDVSGYTAWAYGTGSTYYGIYRFAVTFNTGWYNLEVGVFEGVNTYASLTSTVKFGVGDVIFIAGQSNAQGTDGITNSAVDNKFYDCVNSISSNQICKNSYQYPAIQKIQDGSLIAPTGNRSAWAYNRLGSKITDASTTTVVPTLFFNTAFTGSSVENWSVTAADQNASVQLPLLGGATCCQPGFADWDSQGSAGQPYKTLKNSLGYYGGMFGARAVLWHQGESDNMLNTAASTYRDRLMVVINKTRQQFNPNLGWAISRASRWNGTVKATVISGQELAKAAATSTTGSSAASSRGAWDSDANLGRISDNTHFNASGLQTLGDDYFANYQGVGTETATKNLPPVAALTPPPISIDVTGTDVTLTAMVSGGYTYSWVQTYDGNMSSPTSTYQAITVSNNQTRQYRCYATDSQGRTTLSQAIYTPVKNVSGARIGAEEIIGSAEIEELVPLKVSPNPTKEQVSLTFNLKEASNVKIDLMHINGGIIASSPEKDYEVGQHQYSFDASQLVAGTYVCRLRAGNYFASKKVVIAP